MGEFIRRTPQADLQLAVGRVALDLVSRSLTDANFYPQCVFLQLLETRYLCYRFELTCSDRLPSPSVLFVTMLIVFVFVFLWKCSVCPELLSLAMVKKDFNLCQIAFQIFSDIPEAVTCAYLKTILR